MEITNIIINVSTSLVVGGGAGFCVFQFLGQKWVGNWFAKDLKKYEQQLDILKMQKHLQFSNVYTKRAEVITKVYNLLVGYFEIEQELINYLHHYKEDGHDNRAELKEIIVKMCINNTSLTCEIERNKLYFSSTDANHLMNIAKKIKSFIESHSDYYEYDQEVSVSEYMLNALENSNVLTDVNESRSVLEERFRKLIGVNDDAV